MFKVRIRPKPSLITVSVQKSHKSLAPIMTVMTFQSWRKFTLYIEGRKTFIASDKPSQL